MSIYGQMRQSGALSVTSKDADDITDSGGGRCGLWNNGTLTINGVTVEAMVYTNGWSGNSTDLWNNGTLTINGGTLLAVGEGGTSVCGIFNNGEMNILGGTVTATAGSTADDEHVGVVYGIINYGALSIRGGTVTATATDVNGNANRIKAIVMYDGSLTLPDSYKWRTAEDGIFTQHICTLPHYTPGEETYAQIIVPGDVPYHAFGTWIDEDPATCTENGIRTAPAAKSILTRMTKRSPT